MSAGRRGSAPPVWAGRVVLAAGLEQRVCPWVQASQFEAETGLLDLLVEELFVMLVGVLAEEEPGRLV